MVDHPLLDRLIRGRTWIGIAAFALIGIVAMQVALLDLNTGIGRSVVRAAALQDENAMLTMQVSTMRAAELRQAAAGQLAMVHALPGDVRYLTVGQADPAAAAAAMVSPRTLGPGLGGRGQAGDSSQSSGVAPRPTAGGAAGATAAGAGSGG